MEAIDQKYHGIDSDPSYWPVPSGLGVLVEIYFEEVTQNSSLHVPSGNVRNKSIARVRAVGPSIPDEAASLITDDQTPGAVGFDVLIPEANLRYLHEEEYLACDQTVPTPENGFGDLAHINCPRIIGIMKNGSDRFDPSLTTEDLKFQPMGKRVIFEYDYDEESSELHQTDGGLYVREKDKAADNLMATVRGVGPKCEQIQVGDRIIVKRYAGRIPLEGEEYNFVSDEDELIGVMKEAE